LFGTFQEEEERPTYGITKPINSWNAVWANFSHYDTMIKEMKMIPSVKDKIRYMFNKPGWFPEYLGGYRPAPPVDRATYHKYDTPSPMALNYYVLFQYAVCLAGTSLFLFNQTKFSMGEKAVIAILISIVVVNCGVLFENKPWVRVLEWIRIILYPATLIWLAVFYHWPMVYVIGASAYLVISVSWYYSLFRNLRGTIS
jgi:hypothetical protein